MNIFNRDLLEKHGILYRITNDFPEDGVKFIDLTPSLIDTNCRTKLLSRLVNYIENEVENIDIIICPDARGFLWGSGVATLMNCSLLPVRKTGKLPPSSILTSIKYGTEYSVISLDLPFTDLVGKRCFFVDDVYATGGTYRACKQMVNDAGGEMIGCAVIYDVGIDTNEEVFAISRGDL